MGREIFIFGFLLLLFVNISLISASHNADQIIVKIDGTDRTLEYAVNNKLFSGTHTYAAPSTIPNPGHSAANILISTNGGEMSLLSALSGGFFRKLLLLVILQI